jgi:2'-5' RNA ligase
MRAFISLELPAKIKAEIKTIQQDLKKANIQAKWVNPQISHLTLAFLGSIRPNQVEKISQVLEGTGSQIKPVNLYLLRLGCFPNPVKPRVIFVDLAGEKDKLEILNEKIRENLKKEKIWFDKKPFSAHITLGRIKKRKNLTQILKGLRVKKIKFQAKEIVLNKSELDPTGPAYTQLEKVFLA